MCCCLSWLFGVKKIAVLHLDSGTAKIKVCEPTAMNKEQFTGEKKDRRNEWPANKITEIIV